MKLRKRVMMPVYLAVENKNKFKILSLATRIPMQAYLREAVDDVLHKYRKQLKSALKACDEKKQRG